MTSTKIMQVPRRIGVEDFCNLPTYAAFHASKGSCMDMRSPNLREDMLHLFQMQQLPEWDIGEHQKPMIFLHGLFMSQRPLTRGCGLR